jgi:hypothetical protein
MHASLACPFSQGCCSEFTADDGSLPSARHLSMDPNRYELDAHAPGGFLQDHRACMLDWLALSSRAAALNSPRTMFPCHPHGTPVYPLVSSQAAGSGSRGLESLRLLLARRQRLLRHRHDPSETHVPRSLVPPQPRPARALSDPPPFARSCTARDGSSRPPHLFKRASVQDLDVFPSNTPFPRLPIKPLSKSPPPRETAPPGRFTCSKELVYKPRTPSPNQGLSWLPDRVRHCLPPPHRGTVPPGPPRLLKNRDRHSLKDSHAAWVTHERSFRSSSRSRSR